jgi:para-aminobenzoate synthetase/4-amino-4-deoxychorismate lyase
MRWRDGEFLPDATPPLMPAGVAPFETMGEVHGGLPLWDRHLARLQAAAARLRLPFAPPADLRAGAMELLRRSDHGVLRLSLVPAASGVHWEMATRPLARVLQRVALIPTVCRRPEGGPPPDLKAAPRTFYDDVLAEAQAGGADDGIVLGPAGEVLETATANLWLLLEGTWATPPLDGRILPGIARARLLEVARRRGVATAERVCKLDDLHRARGLAVSNAVHGPRHAVLLAAGRRPAVENPDDRLLRLWPGCLQD